MLQVRKARKEKSARKVLLAPLARRGLKVRKALLVRMVLVFRSSAQ